MDSLEDFPEKNPKVIPVRVRRDRYHMLLETLLSSFWKLAEQVPEGY